MISIKMPVIAAMVFFSAGVNSADLLVKVTGLERPHGEVSCALFSNDKGFPMEASGAVQHARADSPQLSCHFPDLQPGEYAVSVAHDQDGNGRLNTNLVGMPQEQWGVSNNVRPRLRAPRFPEASFRIAPDQKQVALEIKVAK